METKQLHLDYETRSELDLNEVGLDRYVTHPSTEVILAAYAYGPEPVKLWQPHQEEMPGELFDALTNPDVMILAWHSPFERLITQFVLGIDVPIQRFLDPNINARYMSLPGYLYECGTMLNIPHDKQKLKEGEQLLQKFCLPAKVGGQETLFGVSESLFRDHETDPEDWALFCKYCIRDVEAEREIWNRMEKFRLPQFEWETYYLDQIINDRGIFVDLTLVSGAVRLADQIKSELTDKLRHLTGLENPNSRDQMLEWCRENGYPSHGLGKAFVNTALAGDQVNQQCREALTIRKQAAKTSDTKYDAILREVSSDGRIRHQYVFAGAARTHRWASHGIQIQNMMRPVDEIGKKIETAIEILRTADIQRLKTEFKTEPMDVIGSCIRSSFRAKPGYKLVICDLSSIENRVLGYICQASSILKVFEDKLDPYKYFAVDLFHKPYDQITKDERQNSKPPVLGCVAKGASVLTDRGWIPIETVTETDCVFDGLAFVSHDGVISKGDREILSIFPLTYDHEVLVSEDMWEWAGHVQHSWQTWEAVSLAKSKLLKIRDLQHLPSATDTSQILTSTKQGFTPTYDILNCGPRNRFMILTPAGPLIVHNCGYGLSGGEQRTSDEGDIFFTGLMQYARSMGIPLSKELADESVRVFRKKHHEVVQCWWDLENAAMSCIKTRKPQEVNDVVRFEMVDNILRAFLPSGRSLHYVEAKVVPRIMTTKDGREIEKETIEYWGNDQKNHCWGRVYTYGSKILENCLAGGTLVVTDRGPTPMSDVRDSDKLWDGQSWVSHNGVIEKGTQETIEWIGLRGTREHLILAGGRWRELISMDLTHWALALQRGHSAAPKCWIDRSDDLYTLLSNQPAASIKRQRVYDILNAGPNRRFTVLTTLGPVIVHNCDQSISRDLLVEGMKRAEGIGMPIVMHTHDEIVCEIPENSPLGIKELRECMITPPSWGNNQLLIDAAGFESIIYRKE